MITPNRVEALALEGMTTGMDVSGLAFAAQSERQFNSAYSEPDWSACGNRLKQMGPTFVVITLGSQGCCVIDTQTRSIPAPRVEAVDTVGAGDAFNGALAAALAANGASDILNSAAWANAAAALAVTKPGAQSALAYRDAIDRLARGAVLE
jgi:ribokinase